MKEIWKDIEGHEGKYEVSNTGKVRSLDGHWTTKTGKQVYFKGRILKQQLANVSKKKSYLMVTPTITSERKHNAKYVHRLVAKAFIEVPDKYKDLDKFDLVVDHIDNDSTNNSVDNLQWLSRKENASKDCPVEPKRIKVKELNVVFNSQAELARFLQNTGDTDNPSVPGIISNIRKAITTNKPAYGWTYEYKEEK